MTESTPKPPDASGEFEKSKPSVGEHGENGYTENAVGGFGAGYEYQVAHGAESESVATASDSERDSDPGRAPEGGVAQAVRKTLGRAHIDAADLRVEATGSEVHLYGTVKHLFEKTDLEARARGVSGVSSVISHLAVQRADWQENS